MTPRVNYIGHCNRCGRKLTLTKIRRGFCPSCNNPFEMLDILKAEMRHTPLDKSKMLRLNLNEGGSDDG